MEASKQTKILISVSLSIHYSGLLSEFSFLNRMPSHQCTYSAAFVSWIRSKVSTRWSSYTAASQEESRGFVHMRETEMTAQCWCSREMLSGCWSTRQQLHIHACAALQHLYLLPGVLLCFPNRECTLAPSFMLSICTEVTQSMESQGLSTYETQHHVSEEVKLHCLIADRESNFHQSMSS